MKKLLLPLMIVFAILGGCLPEDYNLRTIHDTTRRYEGVLSDSLSTGMMWNTPDWKAKNVKYWRSAGVIITSDYNAFYENSWLKDIFEDGFEGTVYVEETNPDLLQLAFGSSAPYNEADTFFKDMYTARVQSLGITGGVALNEALNGTYVFYTNKIIPFVSTQPTIILNSATFNSSSYRSSTIAVWNEYFEETSEYIGDTEEKVKWGVMVGDYSYDTWNKISYAGVDSTKFSMDGTKVWSNNTTEEKKAILHGIQNAKVDMFADAGIPVIVKGSRLSTELDDNVDLISKKIVGFMFDDVNPSNIDQFESDLTALRSANTALIPEEALLIIAGVQNDVYHSTSPTVYATFIQRLINDGVYFTPGADGTYWNMPRTNPGDWWVRGNDDSNWKSFTTTYSSANVGPRKILGATEVLPYDIASVALGLGGGGWLEAGAWHPTEPDHLMLGADITNAYYSSDRGETFKQVVGGTISREDKTQFFSGHIIGIDNGVFSGFIQTTVGGIYSFAINEADTFVSMTPQNSPTGYYIAEKDRDWGYWVEPIPFCGISTAGDQRFIVASAGKYRYDAAGANFENDHYPENYVTVNYTNPVGRQGLWYYNYNEGSSTRKWRPLERGYDSWNPEHGIYRAIDLSISETDTLVLAASGRMGPQLFDVTNQRWTDLASFPWYNHDGTLITPTWGQVPNSINNIQTVGSVYLTDRMTAYVAVQNRDGAWAGNSGIYRMHNVQYPTSWEWVGDQTLMPWQFEWDSSVPIERKYYPVNKHGAGAGNDNRANFTYLNVAEGTNATDPDSVFAADRSSGRGLSRIVVPYGHGPEYDQLQTWEPLEWMDSFNWEYERMPRESFPVNGYNENVVWAGIIFEPMINPMNSQEIIVQDNVILIRTLDGGANWESIEPKKQSDNYDLNATGGYIETCTNGLSVLSDGRLVVSNGDVGLAVSLSADDWTRFDNINSRLASLGYLYNGGDLDCDSDLSSMIANKTLYGYPTDDLDPDLVYNTYETSAVHTEPNWDGTGRDALFFSGGKRIGEVGLANIFMWHDSDNDGVWELTSVTTESVSPQRWKYAYYWDIAWSRSGNDVSFYAPYKLATVSCCYTNPDGVTPRFEGFGVHKFAFDSTTNTWTRSDLNNFSDFQYGDATYTTNGYSPYGREMTPYDIKWSSAENKLYLGLAMDAAGDFGGLYELDLDDGENPLWVKIMGENTGTGNSRENAVDVQSLAMSDDGTTLYVSSRGEQGGKAGVWKLTNLDNDVTKDVSPTLPTWNLPTMEMVVNNADKVTAWLPMPPSRYGEILTDHRSIATIGSTSTGDAKAFGLLINPNNNDQVWMTVRTRSPQHTDNGLWALDTNRNILKHVVTPFDESRATWSDENLHYDSVHIPNRIVVGTDCSGVYYINYDGIFHTDKEDATKPLPIASTAIEYPPTGVYTVNGSNTLTVYWNYTANHVYNDLDGFYVWRSDTEGGTYSKVSSLITPVWSNTLNNFKFVDSTVTNGNTYWYKIGQVFGGVESATLSNPVKGSPRLNYMLTWSTEDFWGDQSASLKWAMGAFTSKIYTSNPFTPVGSVNNPPIDETSAQGFISTIGENNGQIFTPSTGGWQVAQDNWVLVSAYVKSVNVDGVPITPGSSAMRMYNRTTSGNIGYTQWNWTSDPEVITFTSTAGAGATQPDAIGSYYVGDGWHRVWYKVNLAARSITGIYYSMQFSYNVPNTVGNGAYLWGLMLNWSSTEPTELCDYIPVRPMTYAVQQPPRYIGDENCVTLSPATPSTISSLAISGYGDGEIDLSWDADVTADYYSVTRGTTSGGQVAFSTTESPALTDIVAFNYVPYFYKVTTTNEDGVTSAASNEVQAYANEWIHDTVDCSESNDIVFNPPDFGSISVAADSGMVDFAFVYDEDSLTYHIIGIDGQLVNWFIYNNTTTPNATQLVHYTSTDLLTWTRSPNIPLYDAVYATTNVWAPHIIKYGDTWYMFYTGTDNAQPGGNARHLERIMVSTSADLYSWSAGSVVLEGNVFADGITDFTLWNTTGDGDWRNDCRDAFIRRNSADNGWTMYTGVQGDPAQLGGNAGMLISLARSLDADYGGNSELSLVGTYEQYDYLIQTSNSSAGYCESPWLSTEPDGYTYIFWTTNSTQGSTKMRTLLPDVGTLGGNTWSSPDLEYDRKAPEMIRLTTGEYISAYLEEQLWVGGYFHVKFERVFIYPDGSIGVSNIVEPSCFGGNETPWYTNIAANLVVGDYIPVAEFSGTPLSGQLPLTVTFVDESINNPTSWSWNFGDSGTSTLQNPTHEYTSGGEYTVSLTATNSNGSDSETKVAYVAVSAIAPVAEFSGTPTTGSIPLEVTFTDESTNSPTEWLWDFGDGSTSTQQNPVHTYTVGGLKNVSLLATNESGSDSESKASYIFATTPPAPVAEFSATPLSGIAPLTVTFTDESTNTPTSWSWNFHGLGTSTLQNPTFEFVSAGTYLVALTATNAYGQDTEVKLSYINVAPATPVADFTGTPLSGTSPLTVTFTDASTNSPTSWSWNFGDSGTSTSQNPSHEYADAGTYTVALTATNETGSDGETKVGYVTVTSPPTPPVAAFSGTPLSGTFPLTVTFTDASTNSPTSWSWDFGDSGTSTLQNPSHEYTAAGTYDVVLTATNAGGSDGETKVGYVTVSIPAPIAEFSGTPLSGVAPLTVTFTDASTNTPTSWNWNFGDSGTSTLQNPTHEYTTDGTYTVTLTATNATGSDGETKVGYVTATPASTRVTDGLIALYEFEEGTGSTVSDSQTSPLNLTIADVGNVTWGDGSVRVDSGTKIASSAAAAKLISASKTSDEFTIEMWLKTSTESQSGPARVFTISPASSANGNVMFGHGANLGGSTTGIAVRRLGTLDVSVGSGAFSANQLTHYAYTRASDGVAKLYVNGVEVATATNVGTLDTWVDGYFLSLANEYDEPTTDRPWLGEFFLVAYYDRALSAIEVDQNFDYGEASTGVPPAPVAAFSGTPLSGAPPLTVTFTDASTNSPTSWAWNFGDSGTSTSQNPTHEYASDGTYTVTLTATNANGSDAEVKAGYVTVTTPSSGEPTITGVGGLLTVDSTITLSGSNFGATGPNVIVFDDFERGTVDAGINTTDGTGGPRVGTWTLGYAPLMHYSDTAPRGNLSAFTDASDTDHWYTRLISTFTGTREIFVSYWVQVPPGSTRPSSTDNNWKTVWEMGNGLVSGEPDGSNNDMTLAWRDLDGLWYFGGNDQRLTDRNPDENTSFSYSMSDGHWAHNSWYRKANTTTAAPHDGKFRLMSLNTDPAASAADKKIHDVLNLTDAGTFMPESGADGLLTAVWFNGNVGQGATGEAAEWDDCYVATGPGAQARVEIGNNAVYTECTNLAICVPTAWADGLITFKLYTGSFGAGSAYLFVTDQDGVTSSGYPVTLGAEYGSLIDGASSVIEGSGFGTKTTAAPLVFETFDVAGASQYGLIESNQPEWQRLGAFVSNYYTGVDKHSGTYAAGNDVTMTGTQHGTEFGSNWIEIPSTTTVFSSFWFKLANAAIGEDFAIVKLTRIGPYSLIAGGDYNGAGITLLSSMQPQTGNDPYLAVNPSGTEVLADVDSYLNVPLDTWCKIDLWTVRGTPGVADGYVGARCTSTAGVATLDYPNILVAGSGQTFTYGAYLMGMEMANYWNLPTTDMQMYNDDVYIDNTFARVELGNAATYETSTHLEMQYPTSWTDTSITITVNKGTLPSGAAYLFVINANNTVVATYPVTLQ